jgi:signal transduction histidine kinase
MTTVLARRLRPGVAGGSRAGWREALASEWTKIRTVRSTVWTLVVMAALTIAFAVFVGFTKSLQPDDTILGGSLTGAVSGLIAAGVFGVLAISGEYGTGLIRATLTACPRRVTVLAAKTAVVAASARGHLSDWSAATPGPYWRSAHGSSAAATPDEWKAVSPVVPKPRFAAWLRTLQGDLAPSTDLPLLPLRSERFPLLAWSPHVIVLMVAAILAGFAWHTLIEDFAIPNRLAGTLAVAHAVSVVLCLYWPMSGWWMSLLIAVVTSVAAQLAGAAPPLWTGPSLVIHLTVLLVAGLRVRPRVLVEMWLLTLLAGSVLALALPGRGSSPDIVGMVDMVETAFLSGAVLVLAGAVRGRSEALRRLAEARDASEAERARRALLEERARIARELHDVVAHHMSVIAIQAEAAPYRVSEPPPELARSFGTIRSNALAALTELRRVLGVLRASEGGDPGGDSAPQPTLSRLDELVTNARAAGLSVSSAMHGTPQPLPQAVELSAYRIAQEALSNAIRHAPGSDVRVEVAYRPASLELRVRNGAPRVKAVSSAGPGHGVVGMRERVAMLGGQLASGPEPGGGYAVVAVLPIGRDESA